MKMALLPTSRNEGKVWIFENPNTKAGDVPAWDMCASLAGKKWDSDHN